MKKNYSSVRKYKFEHSAGGIIYRIQSGQVQFLMLKDRNGNWTFPKGWIEKEEDYIAAAKREIAEEVGITNVKYKEKIDTNKYWYKFEGIIIRKEVEFFLFEFIGEEEPKPQTEEGIQEVRWVATDEALEIVGYPKSNKPLLDKAIRLIKNF